MTTEETLRPPWTQVTAGGAVPSAEPPVRTRSVVLQVVAGALVVLVLVALAGVVASRRLAEAEAVNDAAKTANILADALVQPALTDGLLTSAPAAVASMDAVIRQHVLGPSIVRVKIWDPQGRIVYSDEPALIGQTFPLGDDERDVLTRPETRADISDLQAPENRYEQGRGKLLEVYRPVWTPSGSPLLFETYAPYDQVTARSGQLWRGFAGITLSSLLLLVVLMMPILWRLLERLKLSQLQREALLQSAVDASTRERRRIAGALHDGVVQDLVATSFTAAGAAERATSLGQNRLAEDLVSVAGTVRTSIGGLRSLLVDIYPPSLATAGLAAALSDLASSLRSRGITVLLDVPGKSGLSAETERLVFRVTQECLTNTARHASASRVRIALVPAADGSGGISSSEGATPSDGTVLEVEDDGVGFDAAAALAHPPEGHFGLRVLADVAAEARADLRLATAPGMGTLWQLRIPAWPTNGPIAPREGASR